MGKNADKTRAEERQRLEQVGRALQEIGVEITQKSFPNVGAVKVLIIKLGVLIETKDCIDYQTVIDFFNNQ